MLIIEGTDLVGKTTLCNELIKQTLLYRYPIIYQHFGKLPKADVWDYFEDYIPFINQRVCMDRFILSEVAYGNTIRGHSEISPDDYRELDGWLRINQSVTVLIVAEQDWLKKQLDEKYHQRNELFEAQQIIDVNEYYRDLAHGGTDWECDIDFVYTMNDRQEFPSSDQQFVQEIVHLLLRRTKHEASGEKD